jgi:hypothetical protein
MVAIAILFNHFFIVSTQNRSFSLQSTTHHGFLQGHGDGLAQRQKAFALAAGQQVDQVVVGE